MSLTSSEPDLVLEDLDKSDNGENGGPLPVSNHVRPKLRAQQRERQDEWSQTENGPPQQHQSAAASTNALHEILEIINWVNTGRKREGNCEKTFMEKKFEEMETTLIEKEERLEQALLEICVLKQMKTGLETEIGSLRQQLETEMKENATLNDKWYQMKATFQALQTKFFEETPTGTQNLSSGYDVHTQGSSIVHLTEEDESEDSGGFDDMYSEFPFNHFQTPGVATTGTWEPAEDAFSVIECAIGQPEITVDVVEPGADEAEIQLDTDGVVGSSSVVPEEKQPVASSSISSLEPSGLQKSGTSKCEGEGKLGHGVDVSKEHLGAFCVCGLKCSTKKALGSHIIYFTCEKKFACTICQKRFVGSNYLKGHMIQCHKVTYTGGMNGCRDCGKTFSTLLQLRQHKKLAHGTSTNRSTKTSTGRSARNRRSFRMRLRRQEKTSGEANTALKMLKGNCNNCQFCREQQRKQSKSRKQTTGNAPVQSTSSSTGTASRTRATSQHSSCEPLQ